MHPRIYFALNFIINEIYFQLKVSQLWYYIYNTTTVCSIEFTVQYLFEQVHARIELKKWYGFSIFLPAPFFVLCVLK